MWDSHSQTDSQGKKTRLHGNEAVKSHILAARTVANIVKTSLVGSTKSPMILDYSDSQIGPPRTR
jgi:chaperonin GroEL (HSP60 family)